MIDHDAGPPPRGIAIETLGDLRRLGYRLNGFCRACGKSGDLDLDALIARLGEGRSYLRGSFTVRCACGAVADYHVHQPMPKLR
tara:strand:+ start:116 stop:367 length:252 start_codon:yes stop_codon:yes gene_type:complete